MAINTFASFPRSTPTAALEIMLDIKPLHLFCKQEALAARVRLDDVLDFGWHGTSHTKNHAISHLKFLEEGLDKYNIDPKNTDRCHLLKWSNGFHINRDSFDGKAKHRQPSQYNAYTDGSKMEGQTGAGTAIYKGTEMVHEDHFRLPNGTTVFQAEVSAVTKAADAMIEMNESGMKFVKIFIDSQAAILVLGNPLVKSTAVARAIDSLNILANKVTKVSLVWIPAHKGHAGNEKADELPKRVRSRQTRRGTSR